ncbi:pinin SDK memA [Aspergillus sp. HF37]|nr:pinin SDK memA [Aspergillus sp. HF37]
MTELASAVALPEHDDHDKRPSPAPPPTVLRAVSGRAAERPRPATDAACGTRAGARRGAQARGQRLFGALLGTLSQSSNSTAQRRRADIEKRQQDKLKVRYEEFDGERRKRRDDVVAVRRKERWLYEREEMRTRHSSLRAVAHFLKTRTEPVLYYKPWELRPEDEDIIRDQVDEAETTIFRETADFEARCPPEEDIDKSSRQEGTEEKEQDQRPAPDAKESQDTAPEASDAAEAETSRDKDSGVPGTDGAPGDPNAAAPDHTDAHRGEDDGGVVVEDKEDTVIY